MSIHAPHLLKFWFRSALVFLILGMFAGASRAEERQHHGVAFEKWVRMTFFDEYVPSDPTQKWDIPAAINAAHGDIPVNPKAIKYRSPVDLGDAIRQFEIESPFWLVLGYWELVDGRKEIVNLTAIRVQPEDWRKLWGAITLGDLQRLDRIIKDRSLSPQEARRQAHALNAKPPLSAAVIRLHPKIDTKGQRRLQCSLSFSDLFETLAPQADPERQDRPMLWGIAFPGPLE